MSISMDTATLSTTAAGGTILSSGHQYSSSSSHPIPSLPFRPKPPPLASPLISSSSLRKPPKPKPQTLHPISPAYPPSIHDRAATGYAAALADACLRAGTLAKAQLDSQRLLRDISARVATRFAAAGANFDTRLLALVAMLARKGKASVIPEVLVEFGRMCDELLLTQTVVVVDSRVDGPDRIAHSVIERIARKVGKASGAAKVKVRHVFATP